VPELVEETVRAGPLELRILRPPDADALIDEARFGEDEFMPYWAELWASGVALASAVAERDVRGSRVLELGCGLGLPSVAAALSGAAVLATDWAPEALDVTRRNAERNGVLIETLLADWSTPEPLLERAPFDLVLCADVLYEPRNVDALLGLLPHLGDEVLLGEPGRPTAARFFELAERDWTIGREGEVNVLRRRA
jgi:predicted nicotinamide N-methyase